MPNIQFVFRQSSYFLLLGTLHKISRDIPLAILVFAVLWTVSLTQSQGRAMEMSLLLAVYEYDTFYIWVKSVLCKGCCQFWKFYSFGDRWVHESGKIMIGKIEVFRVKFPTVSLCTPITPHATSWDSVCVSELKCR